MDENIEKFVDDLTKRNFLVFAGAGISKITGICDWRELLLRFKKSVDLGGIDVKEVDDIHFPEIMEMVYVSLEKQGQIDEYNREIEDALQAKDCSWGAVHYKIIKACSSILTTNLDTTFEDALNDRLQEIDTNRACTSQTLCSLTPEEIRKPYNVTYLHGKRGESEVILRTTDYVKHYTGINGGADSCLEKVLKKTFCGSEAIVFVGFSFEDRYITKTFELAFRELMRKSKPEFEPENIRHYALMQHAIPGGEKERENLIRKIGTTKPDSTEFKNCEVLKRSLSIEKRLNAMNIEVIRYEHGKHKELEWFFEQIEMKRKEPKDYKKM